MTFQVGEKVVYPNHGVATIENISSRAFAGHFERFYLLRLTYNNLTVMVPFSHVEELRLRKLTRNNEVAPRDQLSFGRPMPALSGLEGLASKKTRSACATAAFWQSPKC